ncbi:MAG: 3'-5' exonuclease [Bacteroidota bacterium]
MNLPLFTSRRKEEVPDWIRDYRNLTFKYASNTPLEEVTFCCLDCETTGLERSDAVISFGAVKVMNRRIEVGEAMDLRLGVAKGQKHSEIHEELAHDCPDRMEAQLQSIVDYIGNAVIVGHHVSFDIGKINQMIGGQFKGFSLKNKSVDTWHLMRRLDPVRFERNVGGTQTLSLDALCQEFSIDIENRHSALGDAYMTAQLFLKLLLRLKRRKVTKIGQL